MFSRHLKVSRKTLAIFLVVIFVCSSIFFYVSHQIDVSAQTSPSVRMVQGPVLPSYITSGLAGYSFGFNGTYQAYFKSNSQYVDAVNFFNNGYNFTINTDAALTYGALSYYNSVTNTSFLTVSPTAINPQSASAVVSGNTVTYAGAWANTSLSYTCGISQMDETLKITSIPASSNSSANYLQFAEQCYYTSSLAIYANGVEYLNPSGVQFTTNGSITFNEVSDNITEFYLPTPILYDSAGLTHAAGNATLGNYRVLANNGILTIYIEIPTSFLNHAIYPVFFDPAISLVQGAYQSVVYLDSGSFTVSYGSTPSSSSLLILVFTGRGSATSSMVSSVSESNAVWNPVVVACVSGDVDSEIWKGVPNGGTVGTLVTINIYSGTYDGEIADIAEFSGVSSTVDKTAYNIDEVSVNTGTTSTTTSPNELCIGVIGSVGEGYNAGSQNSPTNSFTMLDGNSEQFDSSGNYGSLSLLYLPVTSEGTYSTGTTIGFGISHYSGAIATFVAINYDYVSIVSSPSNLGSCSFTSTPTYTTSNGYYVVSANSAISVTAIPNGGDSFDYFNILLGSGDSSNTTSNPWQTTLDINVTVTAYFSVSPPSYDYVSIVSSPSNLGSCSFTSTPTYTTSNGYYVVSANSAISVTAIPNGGDSFDYFNILLGSGDSSNTTSNPWQTTLDINVTVTAYFSTTNAYTLSEPTLGVYNLINPNGTLIYVGGNASFAINYCSQQIGISLHVTVGNYSDNGNPITIIFNTFFYIYGDGSTTQIAIAKVAELNTSASMSIGNFTWAG